MLAYSCEEELSGGCNMVLDLASQNTQPGLSAFLGSTCELGLTSWAWLLQRVFAVDVMTCPRCRGVS